MLPVVYIVNKTKKKTKTNNELCHNKTLLYIVSEDKLKPECDWNIQRWMNI